MWRARPSVYASACLVSREPAGHGDLGAVQHEVVRQLQRRTDQAERHRRVEHDQVGTEVAGEVVDLAHHPRVRQQKRFTGALDAERLVGVERRGIGVRARQHREPVARKAPPPLPEQRLDAADLGREVVRDEQVLHVGEGGQAGVDAVLVRS